jgi:hypothetical protein
MPSRSKQGRSGRTQVCSTLSSSAALRRSSTQHDRGASRPAVRRMPCAVRRAQQQPAAASSYIFSAGGIASGAGEGTPNIAASHQPARHTHTHTHCCLRCPAGWLPGPGWAWAAAGGTGAGDGRTAISQCVAIANCDMDVDECSSSPRVNGVTCGSRRWGAFAVVCRRNALPLSRAAGRT